MRREGGVSGVSRSTVGEEQHDVHRFAASGGRAASGGGGAPPLQGGRRDAHGVHAPVHGGAEACPEQVSDVNARLAEDLQPRPFLLQCLDAFALYRYPPRLASNEVAAERLGVARVDYAIVGELVIESKGKRLARSEAEGLSAGYVELERPEPTNEGDGGRRDPADDLLHGTSSELEHVVHVNLHRDVAARLADGIQGAKENEAQLRRGGRRASGQASEGADDSGQHAVDSNASPESIRSKGEADMPERV